MKASTYLRVVYFFACYFANWSESSDTFLKSTNVGGRETCVTNDCIKTAASLLTNMNPSVDPCEDFYEFSCGGFHESHAAKGSSELVNIFSIFDEQIKAHLKTLLFKETKKEEPESFQKTREYFNSCVDEIRMKEIGVAPLKNFLSHFGGWPVVEGDNWDEDHFDWLNLTAKLASEGLPEATGIVGVGYFRNFDTYKNREFVMLKISKPYSFMVSGEPFNGSVEQDLYELMVGLATYMGADENRAKEEMKEVWEFETRYRNVTLAKRSPPVCNCTTSENDDCQEDCEEWTPFPNYQNLNETKKGDVAKFITVGDLYNVTDEIDWLSYIRAAYSPHVNLSTTVAFWVSDPVAIQNLVEVIVSTPKRTLANYILWNAVQGMLHLVRDPQLTNITKAYKHSDKFQFQGSHQRPKWSVCLDEIGRFFRIALTAWYSRTYLNQGEKQDLEEMFNNIQKVLMETLNETNWLSDETREKAKKKLLSMDAFVGYPDELEDDKLLETYHKSLVVGKGEYFQNYWNIIKFTHFHEAKLIGHFMSKTYWPILRSVLETNAFYLFNSNSMVIPAPIIRGVYYSKNRPKALNYGAIGAVIGHEIMHGFNEIGDIYPQSNYKWWNEDEKAAFLERAKCTVDWYSRFGSRKRNQLDGEDTLNENLGDIEGMKASYESYQRYVKEHGEEPLLPGLDYSPNQLFWMSYGTSWCVTYPRPLTEGFRVFKHSPNPYRVLGVLSNMKNFAKDFNCPVGSTMNPEEKCYVWGSNHN